MASKRAPSAVDAGKAVAYVRVSTSEQAEFGGSLPMQEARIRAYCEMAGLSLSAVISEEGVSAGKPLHDRPGGAKLLAAITREHVGHVVALKIDRLFRDVADALTQVREWDQRGISLHLVDFGGAALNTSSAMGRMMLTMLVAFAEWERNIIGERTAAVLGHKKATLAVYGTTPYGYQRVGDQLVPDPQEQEVVRRMRELRDEGWSLGRIARAMNREEIPTKKGGKWAAETISYILRNKLHEEA